MSESSLKSSALCVQGCLRLLLDSKLSLPPTEQKKPLNKEILIQICCSGRYLVDSKSITQRYDRRYEVLETHTSLGVEYRVSKLWSDSLVSSYLVDQEETC